MVGDTVTFQIVVANNGAAQATNISLTDQLPAGITYTANTASQGPYDSATGMWTIGTLNNGDLVTLTLSGTVDAGQGGNTITNIATAATGDQPDPSTVGDDLEEAVVVDNTTDLVTVKTLASGTSTPDEGDTVTFNITVTNNGPIEATNVSLTDLLPAGLTATTLNGGITQGSYDSTTGMWTIGTLANGASATLTLEGTVDAGQSGNTITNMTTAATGDQVDPSTVGDDLEETVAVGIPVTDLVTVKTLTSGDATPNEGDTVTFLITVTNNGSDDATGVFLNDLLPAGLTATGNNGIVSQGSYSAISGIYGIGDIAVGDSATLILEGTVDAGQGGNTITNITTAASGDQVDPSTVGDDLEEAVVVNDAADLVTVKTLISGDSTPMVGDTVTFQIVVANNGAAQATNVSLTDSIPTGFTLTGNTTTQGSYVGGLWTIGTLNVGDSATITLTGTIDSGQAGNTITNVTTAATGDQPDPSTVGDDLEEAVVVDNTTDLVTVKTLASGTSTPDEGDTVTFNITVTNNGPIEATNVSLTDLLPAGLTATTLNGGITQGSYDSVTGMFDIGTLAVGDSATLTLEGTVDTGQGGNTITNMTTAATGDQVDPSTVGDDLVESVVVNTIVIADLGIAKSIVGQPVLSDQGYYSVTFEVVVENTGTVDLGSLSLLENLDSQFGAAFVSAGNLSITSGPSDSNSSIAIDSTNWDGDLSPELLDTSVGNYLTVGDSFTIQFEVVIDPVAVTAPLENQVTGSGNAVDSRRVEILDSSNNPIVASDVSDSGTDPVSSNPGDPDDQGTPDDPTIYQPAPVPLGTVSGTVFQDDNGDGIQQLGERGIPGVEIILTGTDVYGNPVDVTVFTDANGDYSFNGLTAGSYSVTQTQPLGYDDGIDVGGDPSFTVGNDSITNIQLGFGQAFANSTFAELLAGDDGTTSGNPPQLRGLPPISTRPISDLIDSFIGAPGPIYSGIPINANVNPLTLDSGRPVTGGYSLDAAVVEDTGDCGCEETIDPSTQTPEVINMDPCGNTVIATPIQPMMEDPCGGCGPILPGQIMTDGMMIDESMMQDTPMIEGQDSACVENGEFERTDAPHGIGKAAFLKRFTNWLSRSNHAER
jgi:uncharacterized repeat protein (TIGR01451 family)